MATITQRGPLQWQAIIRKKGFPTQYKTFDTELQAKQWARAVERELDQGLFINRSAAENLTLGQVLEIYRDEVVPDNKGAALDTMRINALCKYELCKYSMLALTPALLSEWRDERLKAVSPATVNRELNIISAAINRARKDNGLHVDNVVEQIRRPKQPRGRDRILSEAEQTLLVKELSDHVADRDDGKQYRAGAKNPYMLPLVQLALATAMRQGELLALRWENVDLKERFAHLPDTKNGESRDVPLSSAAVAVLKGLLEDKDGVQQLPTGLVFKISRDAVKKAFTRAVERAGLKDLHFHDLRHTATTRIAEKLDNILELSAVTGHKDLKMLKRYYHPKASKLAQKLG